MKKTKTDRKLTLNLETLANLTGDELNNVVGGIGANAVIELTKDKNEANCTYTKV